MAVVLSVVVGDKFLNGKKWIKFRSAVLRILTLAISRVIDLPLRKRLAVVLKLIQQETESSQTTLQTKYVSNVADNIYH